MTVLQHNCILKNMQKQAFLGPFCEQEFYE